MPRRFSSFSLLVPAASVPSSRRMWNCSFDSRAFHSSRVSESGGAAGGSIAPAGTKLFQSRRISSIARVAAGFGACAVAPRAATSDTAARERN